MYFSFVLLFETVIFKIKKNCPGGGVGWESWLSKCSREMNNIVICGNGWHGLGDHKMIKVKILKFSNLGLV
jgi:hypothetical protein